MPRPALPTPPLLLPLLVLLAALALAAVSRAAASPAAAARDSDPVEVFILPHSHCDPGYRLTYQEYYDVLVKLILDSVTATVSGVPERRFIWSEQSFFQLWWQGATDENRAKFKAMIDSGQIEFVNGGWVMEDEADSTLEADIDQMTVGHEYVLSQFGKKPNIGWQIDPFGASPTTATIFRQMGMNRLIINRIPYALKDLYRAEQTLEFNWHSSPYDQDLSIRTHVLDTHYTTPDGFDFEDPTVPEINSTNVAERSALFASILKQRASWYRTKNLLLPFGSDFHYFDAPREFDNIDKLMAYINNNASFGLHLRYSTLSEYFDALDASGVILPEFSGQTYLPYAMEPGNNWWSGFYTSIPELKISARQTASLRHTTESLVAVAQASSDAATRAQWTPVFDALQYTREQTALLQHHDAITGTCFGFVVDNYLSLLAQAREGSQDALALAVTQLLTGRFYSTPIVSSDATALIGMSVGATVPFVVVSGAEWARWVPITIGVYSTSMQVTTVSGSPVTAQIVDNTDPDQAGTKAPYLLTCIVRVDAVGYVTLFATRTASAPSHTTYVPRLKVSTASVVSIQNPAYVVSTSATTGLLASVTAIDANLTVPLAQQFWTYYSTIEDTYTFRPADFGAAYATVDLASAQTTGPLFAEIEQTYGERPVGMRVRLYVCPPEAGGDMAACQADVGSFIETHYRVGDLPLNSDYVTRFSTGWHTAQSVWTDENGYTMRERAYNSSRLPGGNYFSVTQLAQIIEPTSSARMSLITASTHGTGSMQDGSIELMLHRRGSIGMRGDDGSTVYPLVRMMFTLPAQDGLVDRQAVLMQRAPVLLFATQPTPANAWRGFTTQMSGLRAPLPDTVELLSLMVRNGTATSPLVVRLRGLGGQPGGASVDVDLASLLVAPLASTQARTLNLNSALEAPTTPGPVTVAPGTLLAFFAAPKASGVSLDDE